MNYLVKIPPKSKVYSASQLLFLLAMIASFVLVPYTLCTGVAEVLTETLTYEIAVDFVFVWQIAMQFTTAFMKENEWITDPGAIATKYCKDSLFVDALSTLPTLLTWYRYP